VRLLSGRGGRPDSRAAADRFEGAELVIVPGAGHVVNLQKPDEVSAALHEFLDGLG